jgi:PPK2 family polyphosphate:nucleotide phosphotransferase
MSKEVDLEKLLPHLMVSPKQKVSLVKDFDPGYKAKFVAKEEADAYLLHTIERMAELQDKLYAQDTYGLLILFQAMDAAGKDSTIKHVMSGINPQGCQVFNFKTPSTEDLDHDYLWRSFKALPERGRIGIFNRSYYEETLIVRIHPELYESQKLPDNTKEKDIWKRRFEEINNFEKYLVDNGIIILKFFLNVSKQEQKRRFLERIDKPEKNWKFSATDIRERSFWDDYMNAYEDIFNHTSTSWAPWYVIPADHKWFTHLAVGTVIYSTLESLNLKYPTLSEEHMQQLLKAKEGLNNEP